MNATRIAIALGLMTAVLTGALGMARGRGPEDERAATIKAGMVLNFIRYTEWPGTAFESAEHPIVVGVLGDGVMASQIDRTMAGQRVHGRAVEVRRLERPEPLPGDPRGAADGEREFEGRLRAAHLLFLCDSEADRVEGVLERVSGADVLTVSDIAAFAEHGGMLGLAIRREKVAFDANPDRIQGTRLKVSSQLLRLARPVKTGGS
jgi:hypothetical protein